ncbi:MAG: redox-sensing transcriptional repressor Rex [Prevotellaceae bacterium]|jgi:redox-sensing transcriptional repressor|nr:redox-sensing transcriptional repressor Rex [Prevotellaceae bacterium]
MILQEKNIQNSIPEPTLRRLPWYLAYAKLTLAQGETMISSTQIAKNIAVDAAVVAKDLSFVNISGKTRVGYDNQALIATLENFLGFTRMHKAYLFGVGRLGGALLQDNGLQQYGIEIVAGFDAKYELAGTSINHIPIHHVERFAELELKSNVKIGILTVPVESAQEISDLLVDKGIRAIWNFTPYRIRVPEKVVVQNTSIYAHLAVMFNRLNSLGQVN